MSNSIWIDPSAICVNLITSGVAHVEGGNPVHMNSLCNATQGGWQVDTSWSTSETPLPYLPCAINDIKGSICQAWKGDFIFLTNMTIFHEVFAYTSVDSSSFILFKSTFQTAVRGALQNTNLTMSLSCFKTVKDSHNAHRQFFSKRNGQEKETWIGPTQCIYTAWQVPPLNTL